MEVFHLQEVTLKYMGRSEAVKFKSQEIKKLTTPHVFDGNHRNLKPVFLYFYVQINRSEIL